MATSADDYYLTPRPSDSEHLAEPAGPICLWPLQRWDARSLAQSVSNDSPAPSASAMKGDAQLASAQRR
jgi:hypothetical protein